MMSAGDTLAASMTLDQCWAICKTWYARRLDLDYQRPPLDDFQRLLGGGWAHRGRLVAVASETGVAVRDDVNPMIVAESAHAANRMGFR